MYEAEFSSPVRGSRCLRHLSQPLPQDTPAGLRVEVEGHHAQSLLRGKRSHSYDRPGQGECVSLVSFSSLSLSLSSSLSLSLSFSLSLFLSVYFLTILVATHITTNMHVVNILTCVPFCFSSCLKPGATGLSVPTILVTSPRGITSLPSGSQ